MLRGAAANLVVLALPLVAGTGHQSSRSSTSRGHLLNQIASSTPYHIRGTPQEDFDCSWRGLAWEWAPALQPWLNGTQRRQIFDALELGTTCKQPSPIEPLDTPLAAETTTSATSSATTIYVAPAGSDDAAGTQQDPFATIARAVEAARVIRPIAAATSAASHATIYLRAGTYYLAAAVELDDRDSHLTISAYNGEHVVISGGVRISGLKWQPSVEDQGDAVYVADVSSYDLPRGIPALLHRGQRATLARYPNANPELDLFPLGYISDQTDWFPPEFHVPTAGPDGRGGTEATKKAWVVDHRELSLRAPQLLLVKQ